MIYIFGKQAERVMVNGHSVKLLDVDQRRQELHVKNGFTEEWVPYSAVRFDGKRFGNDDIRIEEEPSELMPPKRKRAKRASKADHPQTAAA